MRIGVYAGTFDPAHNGHIALAQAALHDAGLDRVVFIPEPVPRGKERVTALTHRLRMLELACTDQEQLSVIALHSRRFTVRETLPELRGLFPGATLALIIGSDVVRQFGPLWPGLDEMLQHAELVVGLRGSDLVADIDAALAPYPDALYTCIAAPEPHAASSAVRRTAAQAGGVPRAVASYITAQKLYL